MNFQRIGSKGRALPLGALVSLVATAGLSSAVGCGRTCSDINTYACDGNTLEYCFPDDTGPVVHSTACGTKFCRTVGTYGFCALQPDPSPSCAGVTSNPSCDAHGQALSCVMGYVLELGPLCRAPQVCVARAYTGAYCAYPSDARCPASTSGEVVAVCDSSHAIGCQNGFRISDTDCGSPELCYTPAPGQSGASNGACVLSLTPDPRCQAIASGSDTHQKLGCVGNQLFQCLDDLFVVGPQDCGALTCTNGPAGTAICAATPGR